MHKKSQDKSVVVNYRAEYIALREVLLFKAYYWFYNANFSYIEQCQLLLKYLILFLSLVLACVGYLSIILINKFIADKHSLLIKGLIYARNYRFNRITLFCF